MISLVNYSKNLSETEHTVYKTGIYQEEPLASQIK